MPEVNIVDRTETNPLYATLGLRLHISKFVIIKDNKKYFVKMDNVCKSKRFCVHHSFICFSILFNMEKII